MKSTKKAISLRNESKKLYFSWLFHFKKKEKYTGISENNSFKEKHGFLQINIKGL